MIGNITTFLNELILAMTSILFCIVNYSPSHILDMIYFLKKQYPGDYILSSSY